MSAWAKPGVKCVCVDASFSALRPDILEQKRVYTIREVVQFNFSHSTYSDERVGFILNELANPYSFTNAFAAARFRPLITKSQEQDVALFQRILDGLRIGEDA